MSHDMDDNSIRFWSKFTCIGLGSIKEYVTTNPYVTEIWCVECWFQVLSSITFELPEETLAAGDETAAAVYGTPQQGSGTGTPVCIFLFYQPYLFPAL